MFFSLLISLQPDFKPLEDGSGSQPSVGALAVEWMLTDLVYTGQGCEVLLIWQTGFTLESRSLCLERVCPCGFAVGHLDLGPVHHSISKFDVHGNHLAILLKCRFWLILGWGLRFCLFDRLSGHAHAVSLWTTIWAARISTMLILQRERKKKKNRGTGWCRAKGRGLTCNSLALVLAELEGPLDEVSGLFLSSLLNSDSVFFGSPVSTLELETQGQKSTFSWQSRWSPTRVQREVKFALAGLLTITFGCPNSQTWRWKYNISPRKCFYWVHE